MLDTTCAVDRYMVLEKRAVPSFSMKGGTKRTDLAANSAGPGPGKYGNIEDKPRGPNARITGRHLEKKVSLADQMRGAPHFFFFLSLQFSLSFPLSLSSFSLYSPSNLYLSLSSLSLLSPSLPISLSLYVLFSLFL